MEEPQPPAPAPAPTRHRLPVAIIGAAVVIAVALIGAALLVRHHNRTPDAAPAAPTATSAVPTAPTAATPVNTGCRTVGAPLVTLDPHADGEPVLGLPQPPGWMFNNQLNSPLIRAVMGDPDLYADDFVPNVVVTLENVTERAETTAQALDAEIDGITRDGLAAALDSDTPGQLCGLPSRTVTYRMAGHGYAATALAVAGRDATGKVWVATATIQTTRPDDPDYVSAKTAILDGFQFSLPTR